MKPAKVSIVPKCVPKPKPRPDDTVYLTKWGERVRITKNKQFPPVQAGDPAWMKEIREKGNEREAVVRISDGHELWGLTRADLTEEKS